MKLKKRIRGLQIFIDGEVTSVKPIEETFLQESLFKRCIKDRRNLFDVIMITMWAALSLIGVLDWGSLFGFFLIGIHYNQLSGRIKTERKN